MASPARGAVIPVSMLPTAVPLVRSRLALSCTMTRHQRPRTQQTSIAIVYVQCEHTATAMPASVHGMTTPMQQCRPLGRRLLTALSCHRTLTCAAWSLPCSSAVKTLVHPPLCRRMPAPEDANADRKKAVQTLASEAVLQPLVCMTALKTDD